MPQEAAEAMNDNDALNAIVVQLEQVIETLTERYDSITGDAAFAPVSNIAPVERVVDPLAVKVVVTNGGPSKLRVYQGNALVAIVLANESAALPMNGSANIKVDCFPGENSQVAIATFRKSA